MIIAVFLYKICIFAADFDYLMQKMPEFTFLKRVAVSRLTQPFAITMSLLLWFLLPAADASLTSCVSSAVPVGMAVWLVREFNVRFVLLRINSKMLSSLFAVLMGFAVSLHGSFMANLIALVLVLIYMQIFSTYQRPHPAPVFVSFAMLSMLTMIVPSMAVYVPFCWMALAHLHAMTPRTVLASLLGLLAPYWFVVGGMYACGSYQMIVDEFEFITTLRFFDYSSVTPVRMAFSVYVFVFLLVGFVEMLMSNYADKVRVRILYQLVFAHGFIAFLILIVQPDYYDEMVAQLIVDAAIVGGHCVAQNYSRATHIFFILSLVIGSVLAYLQATA